MSDDTFHGLPYKGLEDEFAQLERENFDLRAHHATDPMDRSFRMMQGRIEQLERQRDDLHATTNAYRARYQQAEAHVFRLQGYLAEVDAFVDALPVNAEKASPMAEA